MNMKLAFLITALVSVATTTESASTSTTSQLKTTTSISTSSSSSSSAAAATVTSTPLSVQNATNSSTAPSVNTATCLLTCAPEDVTCRGKCVGSAAPTLEQVLQTNKCISDCDVTLPQDARVECHTSCISKFYLGGGNNGSGTNGSSTTTGTSATNGSSPTINPTTKEIPGSRDGGSGALSVASVSHGLWIGVLVGVFATAGLL